MKSEPAFSVRPVVPGDFAAWRVLWDGYNAFYGRHGPTAVPGEMTELTWSRFLDPGHPMNALVAERGGALVGLVHYTFHPGTNHVGPICYLEDLFTAVEARGRGVGRALIEAVYERAARAGSRKVYWQTHESNAVARRLYDALAERSGFIVYAKALRPRSPE